MTRVRAAARTTFWSLRVRNFRLLFVSQWISKVGTWMQTIALEWVVLQQTGSGLDIGLVNAFRFAPLLLTGAWAGVVADRVDKRRMLYATQAVYLALAVLLCVLAATSNLSIGAIFGLALVLGVVTAFDNPARKAIVAETVPPDMITNAVSLNSAVMNASRVIGPALAGAVIAVFSTTACFFVGPFTYLAVPVALLLMNQREMFSPKAIPKAKGQLQEALRYVRHTATVWILFVMVFLVATFAFNFRVVLPLMAENDFHGGAAEYTIMYSLMAAGSLVGTLFVAHRSRVDNRFLTMAAVLATVAMAGLLVAPNVALAALACLFVGATTMAFMSGTNAALQVYAAPNMRGRVMGLFTVVFLGTTPFGAPLVGWICQVLGARAGIAVGGAAVAVAAVLGVRALRRPSPVTADADGDSEGHEPVNVEVAAPATVDGPVPSAAA